MNVSSHLLVVASIGNRPAKMYFSPPFGWGKLLILAYFRFFIGQVVQISHFSTEFGYYLVVPAKEKAISPVIDVMMLFS